MIDTDVASKIVELVKDFGGYAIAGLLAVDKWRGSHAKTLLAVREDVDDARAIDRRSAELDKALARVISIELLLDAEKSKNARIEVDLEKLKGIRDNQQDMIDQFSAEATRWKRLARKAPAAAIAAEFARTDMAVEEVRNKRRTDP